MNTSRVTSPNDVINRLEIIPNSADENMAGLFQVWFARYLRGTGHPTPALGEMTIVTNEMRRLVEGNVTFRAERFLAVATGSELLSPDPEWKATVCVLYIVNWLNIYNSNALFRYGLSSQVLGIKLGTLKTIQQVCLYVFFYLAESIIFKSYILIFARQILLRPYPFTVALQMSM